MVENTVVAVKIKTATEKQLNSPDAFRYIWWIWRVMGMQTIPKYHKIYAIYAYLYIAIFISFMAPVFLCASVFAQPIFDLKMILGGFAINMTFVTTSSKQYLIWFFKKHLIKAEKILQKLDKRIQTESERNHLLEIIRFCHIMYIIYSCVFYSALSGFLLTPLFSPIKKLPFEAWFPFDYMGKYYYLAYLYQIISSTLLAAQNLSNDIYPPCYILILTAHMHVLNERISKIGYYNNNNDYDNQNQNQDKIKNNNNNNNERINLNIKINITEKQYQENLKKLIECIKDHNDVLTCYKEIASVISYTIFVTFLVTAFIICVTGVNLLLYEATVVEYVTAVIYLMVILCESFPCCYLSNRMADEFDNLTNSIYKCNWMDQNQKFRKCVIIFMEQSQQIERLKAGNLFTVSLDTLLGILKFSFSMFSLLSQLK